MKEDFTGTRIWLIGASSGIGRALARELAGRGAALALSARRADELHALCAELGGGHTVLPLDVTDSTAVAGAARQLDASEAGLSGVVLLAGAYDPGLLENMDVEAARKLVDVNLNGAFNLVHAVLPLMRARGRGQIALCASLAGYRGLPAGQPYSATKAALHNLAESLRAEQRAAGLDIKVINPGFVRTPMTDRNPFPMPFLIEPEQAARAIARGLRGRAFEIRFPRRFALLMGLLRLLPAPLYFRVAARMAKAARK